MGVWVCFFFSSRLRIIAVLFSHDPFFFFFLRFNKQRRRTYFAALCAYTLFVCAYMDFSRGTCVRTVYFHYVVVGFSRVVVRVWCLARGATTVPHTMLWCSFCFFPRVLGSTRAKAIKTHNQRTLAQIARMAGRGTRAG